MIEQPTYQLSQLQMRIKMSLERFCPNNHPLTFLCSNPLCQHPNPLICQQPQCPCLKQKHSKCSYIYAQTLIANINKKRKSITPQFQKIIQNLRLGINQLIDKLSTDRDSLDIFIQNFGLNQAQSKLIQFLQTGRMDLINGKIVALVKSKIKTIKQQKLKQAEKTLSKFNSLKYDLEKNMSQSMSWFQRYSCQIQQILAKQPDPFTKKAQKIIKAVSKRKKWRPIVQWVGNNQPLSQMKQLNMSGNSQTHDLKFYQFLKPVTISQISTCLSCLINLTELNLSNNRIKRIQNLKKLNNLKILNLSNNYIQKITNLNKGLYNLRAVLLHQNKIKIIQNLRRFDKNNKATETILFFLTIFDNPAVSYNPVTQHASYIGQQEVNELRNQGVKVLALKNQFAGFDLKIYLDNKLSGFNDIPDVGNLYNEAKIQNIAFNNIMPIQNDLFD